MTTKERTTLFNLCVGLFNIFTGLIVEGALVLGLMFFLSRYPEAGTGILGSTLLPFVLFAGIIIAMIISMKVISLAVRKWNLQDKVDPKAVKKYIHSDL